MEHTTEAARFVAGYLEREGMVHPFVCYTPGQESLRQEIQEKILYIFEFYISPRLFQELALAQEQGKAEEFLWKLSGGALVAKSNEYGAC